MKSKIYFLIVLLAVATLSAAEITSKGEPIELTPEGETYIAPQWSPDGQRLAAGGPSYMGLYLIDFPTGKSSLITDNASAGYGFNWSPDSKTVVARTVDIRGPRRYHRLALLNVDDLSETALSEWQSRLSGRPRFSKDGQAVYLTHTENYVWIPLNDAAQQNAITIVEDGQLVLRDASFRRELPRTEHRIYTHALSPDGEQIAYSTAGQKLWIANADGSDARWIAKGMAPSWSPDGAWITFMYSEDDGHQITSSEIYTIAVDGTQLTNITRTEEVMEMNPQWSPDGSWIVYDTNQRGQLYIQQMEVK